MERFCATKKSKIIMQKLILIENGSKTIYWRLMTWWRTRMQIPKLLTCSSFGNWMATQMKSSARWSCQWPKMGKNLSSQWDLIHHWPSWAKNRNRCLLILSSNLRKWPIRQSMPLENNWWLAQNCFWVEMGMSPKIIKSIAINWKSAVLYWRQQTIWRSKI